MSKTSMIGTLDTINSWEKQTIWNLENRWIATIEFNPYYGEFIKRLDKDGKMWLSSNGNKKRGTGADHYNKAFNTTKYVDLPEFAENWVDGHGLVRPNFDKVYN